MRFLSDEFFVNILRIMFGINKKTLFFHQIIETYPMYEIIF